MCVPRSVLGYRQCGITAAQVKELRTKSGAPMMECKKALSDSEVNGDINKAMDWLRAKGIAKATSQVCTTVVMPLTLSDLFSRTLEFLRRD
jgi:hypothetical protein